MLGTAGSAGHGSKWRHTCSTGSRDRIRLPNRRRPPRPSGKSVPAPKCAEWPGNAADSSATWSSPLEPARSGKLIATSCRQITSASAVSRSTRAMRARSTRPSQPLPHWMFQVINRIRSFSPRRQGSTLSLADRARNAPETGRDAVPNTAVRAARCRAQADSDRNRSRSRWFRLARAGAAKFGVLGRIVFARAVAGAQPLGFRRRPRSLVVRRTGAAAPRPLRWPRRRSCCADGRQILAPDVRHGRLAEQRHADDADVVRPPGSRRVALRQPGEGKLGDFVEAFAPAAHFGRAAGGQDVAGLQGGRRLAAYGIDAVDRQHGQHAARRCG